MMLRASVSVTVHTDRLDDPSGGGGKTVIISWPKQAPQPFHANSSSKWKPRPERDKESQVEKRGCGLSGIG